MVSFVISMVNHRNCSAHIAFAIMENIRNNFADYYPAFLLHIFPVFHYPFYRWAITKEALIILFKCMFSIGLEYLQNEMKAAEITSATAPNCPVMEKIKAAFSN